MMPPSDTEAKSSPQADPVDNRRYYDEFSSSYERHRHHGYHAFIDDLETETVRRYRQCIRDGFAPATSP